MEQYLKPFLPIPDQLLKLQGRGLAITDTAKASQYLQHLGYYRLSGYWYPFRASGLVKQADGSEKFQVLDDFRPGSEFCQVVDLYVFDKRLRVIMLDVLERIEVSLRTNVSLVLGKVDPWAHRTQAIFNQRFLTATPPRPSRYDDFIRVTDAKIASSKEDFVQHFQQKYSDPLPIWVATEVWDFGSLSIFIAGLKYAHQREIAKAYGIARPELLPTWIRTLAFVRNLCAHHSRVWNRSLTAQPKPPHAGEFPELDHLVGQSHSLERVYAAAVLARFFQIKINPTSTWGERFKDVIASFPDGAPGISLGQAGFPTDWQKLPIWA